LGHWEGVVRLLDVRGEAGDIGGDGDDALLFERLVVDVWGFGVQHAVKIVSLIFLFF